MPDLPVMQLSPRQQAVSTHALILAVQREADSRRIREVTRLRRMIATLTREIATLKKSDSTAFLGDIVNVHGIAVPAQLSKVIEAIEDSRSLLALADDWDENGTPGFAEPTWNRAATFLASTAVSLASRHGLIVTEIEILPGSNGGLDIEMRPGNRQLLIVVPADPSKEVRFYGDDGRGGQQIKGTVQGSHAPDWLLMWMAQ